MKYLSTSLLCDFYKISHRSMYPLGTQTVYSTWTPRASRMNGVTEVVHFGVQAFIKDNLITLFNENFFNRKKEDVVAEYARIIKSTLGVPNPETVHIEQLHDLGYLPLSIKSLAEGTVVPLRTPVMTIQNTDKRFFWLTNFVESLASCELWQASTSATIARQYYKLLNARAKDTGGDPTFIQFQGHDFSMRGMSSLRSAVLSGMGHLLSFTGTDTIPAIQAAEALYGANVEKELIGTSIPATEHSIQCAYGNDLEYFRNMINRVHPEGFVSIVSDGYDFWDVIGNVLPALKKDILARNGRVVIRPDSGDPVKIVCGDKDGKTELERKGAIQALWDLFGGTYTTDAYGNKYKLLDSHIGLIYGDAITLNRADEITYQLKEKGFASTNVVFGIGSYTYQYNTRDTFGYALKSTLCVINGDEKQIFKDPKTDNGIKKSQKGKVAVVKSGNTYTYVDNLLLNQKVEGDLLVEVFRDGKLLVDDTFAEIRNRLKNHC
jgi:nicotinamide phosphoribosyltransferase